MRSATQLPPGRHGLSREQVRGSQRQRMLAAMTAAVAERGYPETSVAEIVRRAGVSRETFYEHFAGREECFLVAFDDAVNELTRRMATAIEGAGRARDPLARVEDAITAYLEVLAREEPLARTFLVDVYGAGPAARRRRVAVFERFVDFVADAVGATDPGRRAACEAFVAATSSLVTMRVAVGDHEGLLALHDRLVTLAGRLLDQEAAA